jgi:hypothetical protein
MKRNLWTAVKWAGALLWLVGASDWFGFAMSWWPAPRPDGLVIAIAYALSAFFLVRWPE